MIPLRKLSRFFGISDRKPPPTALRGGVGICHWLDLASDANGFPQIEIDPMALLARSGGKRATDHFEVFPLPERNQAGEYQIYFFAHGLSHYPATAQQRASQCIPGEDLLLDRKSVV